MAQKQEVSEENSKLTFSEYSKFKETVSSTISDSLLRKIFSQNSPESISTVVELSKIIERKLTDASHMRKYLEKDLTSLFSKKDFQEILLSRPETLLRVFELIDDKEFGESISSLLKISPQIFITPQKLIDLLDSKKDPSFLSLLKSKPLLELYNSDYDGFVRRLNLIYSITDSPSVLFNAITGSSALTDLFIKAEDKFFSVIKKISDISWPGGSYDKIDWKLIILSCADSIGKNPEQFLTDLRTFENLSTNKGYALSVFSSYILRDEFGKNPQKIINSMKILIQKIPQIDSSYNYKKIADLSTLFIKNPTDFITALEFAANKNILDYFIDYALANSALADYAFKKPTPFIDEIILKIKDKVSHEFAKTILSNSTVAKKIASDPTFIKYIIDLNGISESKRNQFYEFFRFNSYSKAADLFASRAEDFIKLFSSIKEGSNITPILEGLQNSEQIRNYFLKNTDSFISLFSATNGTYVVCNVLKSETFTKLYFSNESFRQKILTDQNIDTTLEAFNSIGNKLSQNIINQSDFLIKLNQLLEYKSVNLLWGFKTSELLPFFESYFLGKIDLPELAFKSISLSSDIAIEHGKSLDDLHDDEPRRIEFLNSLSEKEVLALLCSPPQLFYTSSNKHLFDRYRKTYGNLSFKDLIAKNNLNNDQIKNFLFRLLRYDLFYGKPNSILKTDADVSAAYYYVMEDIKSNEFDPTYYMLLGNSIKKLAAVVPSTYSDLEARLKSVNRKNEDGAKIYYAIYAIADFISPTNRDPEVLALEKKRATFNIEDYRDKDGKIYVPTIFDPVGTEEHFRLTAEDLVKDGFKLIKTETRKPYPFEKKKEIVEVATYQKDDVIVILHRKESYENKAFMTQFTKDHKKSISVFRGHSYKLESNLPPSVIGNSEGSHVLILGSCGSVGSNAEYINENPNTTIIPISNTSTGRGKVNSLLARLLIT